MRSEEKKGKTAAQTAEKRDKRLRFAGLVILTLLVIAGVIITMFAVRSCEQEMVVLDIGQEYDAGGAIVTVTGIMTADTKITDKAAVFVSVNIVASESFVFDPYEVKADDSSPMEYSAEIDGKEYVSTTSKRTFAAGESGDVILCFLMTRSMSLSKLTYRTAEVRLGSII